MPNLANIKMQQWLLERVERCGDTGVPKTLYVPGSALARLLQECDEAGFIDKDLNPTPAGLIHLTSLDLRLIERIKLFGERRQERLREKESS